MMIGKIIKNNKNGFFKHSDVDFLVLTFKCIRLLCQNKNVVVSFVLLYCFHFEVLVVNL